MDATQLSNLSLFVLNHFSGIWIINWHADAEALAISHVFWLVIFMGSAEKSKLLNIEAYKQTENWEQLYSGLGQKQI